MKLELFDFVEETGKLLEANYILYAQAQERLEETFLEMLQLKKDILVDVSSRLKTKKSLQEKVIRNKYYLNFETPQEVLNYLPDLIGVALECRFISDENDLYKVLFDCFEDVGEEFYQGRENSKIHLNLSCPQPQKQKNGFTIYRLDGYIDFEGTTINFELQIKSLVHRFWGEIEHQVVYKNNQFILYDDFLKNILSSILDNLEIVDHQLETVYHQISSTQGINSEIGFGENGFKLFIAKTINDLVGIKMRDSVGFTTNFKHCSSILSQYIYVKDFLTSENPQYRMAEYIEHFNYLKNSDFDFTTKIVLETPFHHDDLFCSILGNYWQEIINKDYEWHVFFMIVFIIQPGNNIQDFTQFVEIIKSLLFTSIWANFKQQRIEVENPRELEAILAKCLVEIGRIDIVHEEKILVVSEIFENLVHDLNDNGKISLIDFENQLRKQLSNVF